MTRPNKLDKKGSYKMSQQNSNIIPKYSNKKESSMKNI